MTAKLVDRDGRVLATINVDGDGAIYQATDAGRSAAVDLSALFAGVDDATSIEATASDVPGESPHETWVEATPERKRKLVGRAIEDADADLRLVDDSETA